jgi:hypothetical protein
MPTYEGLPAGAESNNELAWSVGIFYSWATGGAVSFALQPEIHFVRESGGISGGGLDVTTATSSIRLPVLFKLELFNRNVFQPSIYIGPSLSYVTGATLESSGASSDIENVNRFQTGLAVGLDVTLARTFVLELRYNKKFTDVSDDITSDPSTISYNLSCLRFGAGFRF